MNLSELSGLWQQFDFIWPWMIAFAPLPWLIRIVLKPAAQRQTPLLAPHLMQRLQYTTQPQLVQPSRRITSIPIIGILLWLLLLLAAMRPVWFLNATPFQASGKDLMLAVDLSGSMEKTDMPLGGTEVDRLTAVKSVVKNFIQKRQGDRMGLVVFGSQAFLQSPLTYDLNTVETLLKETEIGMAGNNTAIGDAIGIALKHLHQNAEKNAVLILLTDGSNTAGAVQPLEAAKQAQKMGLKIYTIGIGRNQATGIDAFIFGSNRQMDTATLQKIAELTHGRFFMAKDTNQLNEIYTLIDQLEATPHDINNYRLREELFIWPLGLVFLLSLLLMGLKLYPIPHAFKRSSEGER
ncbi:VWA domain-containing protein [Hydrogenovibrio sp. 3SP14C1]|uniref:VWA domain-containing protein n=1 Tax=Hydrogenovibrio sp. 3SP14C1 TaxID=3038774 RepID=UPI002417985E|nr:VWA domain-containing protein [Hydrogenovibrio sp. 3SP14C1]MDG4813547.1 VWA domain-containing protein [Hydrogenovibrio sp. 3SP14C1]